ncbi:unnamed protein product [Lampetra planeri]
MKLPARGAKRQTSCRNNDASHDSDITHTRESHSAAAAAVATQPREAHAAAEEKDEAGRPVEGTPGALEGAEGGACGEGGGGGGLSGGCAIGIRRARDFVPTHCFDGSTSIKCEHVEPRLALRGRRRGGGERASDGLQPVIYRRSRGAARADFATRVLGESVPVGVREVGFAYGTHGKGYQRATSEMPFLYFFVFFFLK